MMYQPQPFFEAGSQGPAVTFGREAPGADILENTAMEQQQGITAPAPSPPITPAQQGGVIGKKLPMPMLAVGVGVIAVLGFMWWRKRK